MTDPSTEVSEQGPPGRLSRSRPLTFAVLLAADLLAVVASAQPWWRAEGAEAQVVFKGTESTGGLSQALAVVVLAGTLLVLVLKVLGRQVVAVLLGFAGVAMVAVGALRLRPTKDAVRTKIREVSLIDQYALTSTAWPYVFALAGLGVVLGTVLLWLGAARWAVRPDRFERVGGDVPVNATNDPGAVWKALDAGIDPTDGPEDADPPRHSDPDVRIEVTGDTMEAIESPGQSTQAARSSQPPQ